MHTERMGSSRGISTIIITKLAISTATQPRQSPKRWSDTMRWLTLAPLHVRHTASPLKRMASRANHSMPSALTSSGDIRRLMLS